MIAMKAVTMIAQILVLVGAVNWGLVGLLDTDLVATLLGEETTLSNAVYSLVGVSALVVIYDMYFAKKA